MNYISHVDSEGRITVLSSTETLAVGVDRQTALDALVDAEVDVAAATKILESPAPAEVYFPTLLENLRSQNQALDDSFSEFQQKYKSEKLAENMGKLKKQLNTVSTELEKAKLDVEWNAIRSEWNSESERIRQIVIEDGDYTPAVDQIIIDTLLQTDLGIRFRELMKKRGMIDE